MNSKDIKKYIDKLPEIYQPLFNFEKLSLKTSRSCFDRLDKIIKVYDALKKKEKRDLRVLDLGCSQGFFSFKLAERGAYVTGLDTVKENIEICNYISSQNSDLKVNFLFEDFHQFISRNQNLHFDIILGLSVFHHTAHSKGLDFSKEFIKELQDFTNILISELALKEEGLYWAESLPDNPQEFVSSFKFNKILSFHNTHLSNFRRPLLFSSQKFIYLNDKLFDFDKYSNKPIYRSFPDAVDSCRAYYFSNEYFFKYYFFNSENKYFNQEAFSNMEKFFNKDIPDFNMPKIIEYESNNDCGLVAMEKLEGFLLYELIEKNINFDRITVLEKILDELIKLEKCGFYHNDLRTWNIFISQDLETLTLIDYDSITTNKIDSESNIFYAFFCLIYEIINFKNLNIKTRSNFILLQEDFPNYLDEFIYNVFNKKISDLSFVKIKDEFSKQIELLKTKKYEIKDFSGSTFKELLVTNRNSTFENNQKSFIHYENTIKLISDRATNAENQVQGLSERATNAENQIQGLNERAINAENQVQGLNERAINAENQIQGLNERAINAENEVQELTQLAIDSKKEFEKLNEMFIEINEENIIKEDCLEKLQDKFEEESKKLIHAKDEIINIRKKYDLENKRLINAEKDIRRLRGELEKESKKLIDANDVIIEIQKKYDLENKRSINAEKDIRRLKGELEKESKKLIDANGEIIDIRKKYDLENKRSINAEKDIKRLKGELEEESKKLIDAKDKINNLQLKYDLENERYLNAKLQIEGLNEQNNNAANEIQNLIEKLTNSENQRKELEKIILNTEKQLSDIYGSSSWKISKPARFISSKLKSLKSKVLKKNESLIRISKDIIVKSPKEKTKKLIVYLTIKSHKIVLSNNVLNKFSRKFLNNFPYIETKVRTIILNKRMKTINENNLLKQVSNNQYQKENIENKLLKQVSNNQYQKENIENKFNKKNFEEGVLFIYVEHTSMFDRTTGVQNVCKNSSAFIVGHGHRVILIKLSRDNLNFEPLNELEHTNFLNDTNIPIDHFERISTSEFNYLTKKVKNSWLIIPEVTYHSIHNPNPTSRIIKLARDLNLKVGIIFYDSIPFLTKDASENKIKHANYLSNISLADIIWPISNYSSSFLVDFFTRYENLTDVDFPHIQPLVLPSEMNSMRTLSSNEFKNKDIVCVGTIDERKNQISLIKAFNEYCRLFPNNESKLFIIGMVRDDYKQTIEKEIKNNKLIEVNYSANNNEVQDAYKNCYFSIFPSTEEGYGLPIVESIWNFKPVICANFGSMYEIAKDGGCITIDTKDVSEITNEITKLLNDENHYKNKVNEIISRPIKTWSEYSQEMLNSMREIDEVYIKNEIIYYWLDATVQIDRNSGIQRVSRQLAKSLIENGRKLVPIKWNDNLEKIDVASEIDLELMSKWNGPNKDAWFIPQTLFDKKLNSVYLMVDLPLNRPLDLQKKVVDFFKEIGSKSAAIFYDAIPYKLSDIYPQHFSDAHAEYMLLLDNFDLIIPISEISGRDLLDFILRSSVRGHFINERICPVTLPTVFLNKSRNMNLDFKVSKKSITILSVGTVEPRKNHEKMIKSFIKSKKSCKKEIKLIIAGSDDSFDQNLPSRITELINNDSNIEWIKNANDEYLNELYCSADFTIFPSIEEGFGLPIVESLWLGKPCICANFGQMSELAAQGGCLTVDVKSIDDMSEAITKLVNEENLYIELLSQIKSFKFKDWKNYGKEVGLLIDKLYPLKKDLSRYINLNVKDKYHLNLPKLSICITTYNRSDWLRINLENLFKVTEGFENDIEIIVCDNFSSDDTKSVLDKYSSYSNFKFFSNSANIGMLGNLTQTVGLANGEYIWLLGDDDLIHKGAINKIFEILKNSPELINLNYKYSTNSNPPTNQNLDEYFNQAHLICNGQDSNKGLVKEISHFNENFYTAIYTFIVKRKFAKRIFTQDTSGIPFSNLQTCVPSSKYILTNMLDLDGYWCNEPLITINMNVSWGEYTLPWILERVPDVYDLAEFHGVQKNLVDRWRNHTLKAIPSFFDQVFQNDIDYLDFSIVAFIRRFRHLDNFENIKELILKKYNSAYSQNHNLAKVDPKEIQKLINSVSYK